MTAARSLLAHAAVAVLAVATSVAAHATNATPARAATCPTPSISSLYPNWGGVNGGGPQVTIKGCGFTGATDVNFHSGLGLPFTVVDDGTITTTAPGHVEFIGQQPAYFMEDVTVTTPGGTSPITTSDRFYWFWDGTACSQAGLTASPASPAATGATITLTGTTFACTRPQFRFWVRPPGGSWRIVQDYTAATNMTATYSWTVPNTAAAGTYSLEVDVRDASHPSVPYEKVANITYSLTGCTSASISGSPASPVKYGSTTTVQLTATAACPGTPQYRWWIRRPGERWQIWQDYGQFVAGYPNRFTWNAGGWSPGTYGIEVDVRNQGSSEVYETVFNTTYAIVQTTCGDAGFGAGAVPLVTGVSPNYEFDGNQLVTISGCGFTGTTSVDYWQSGLGSVSNVTVVSDSVITANLQLFPWSWPPGKEPGTQIAVDVRVTTPLGTSPQQPSDQYSFFWGGAPCSSASLTASPASPGATGGTITLKGATFTCTNPYFRFWIRPSGGTWRIVQDYSQTDTYSWTAPKTGLAGTYLLEVDVRDGNYAGAPAYDKVANITYSLEGCTAASLSANPGSPQAHGTQVTLTGSATCLGTPTYRFWVRAPGGAWQIVRDYSTSATFVWTPATAGTYSLEVDVRDQGATATYESVSNLPYTVT